MVAMATGPGAGAVWVWVWWVGLRQPAGERAQQGRAEVEVGVERALYYYMDT